mmetsp:Transcript_15484/g.31457  ORF Transcript_15484/g.31457 Transcript_15484/m.31457 type:complete len:532 (-) Transcript_15484:322-1917(-)
MVCASGLAAAVPAASQMAWVHGQELAYWSEKNDVPRVESELQESGGVRDTASATTAQAAKPPTPAMKEVLKLRKKLREIAKIEERSSAGSAIEPLQQRKLEKKDELTGQLEEAERLAAEAELAQQEQDVVQPPEWYAESADNGLAAQMAPMQLLPLQMVMCDMYGQAQQQAFAWPACSFAAQAPFALDAHPQSAPQQLELCQAVPEEHLGQEEAQPALSTSARRRLRRQRAAERRADAQHSAPASEPPSPRSGASHDSAGQLRFASLAEALEEGGDARAAALAEIRGSVAQLAFDRQGCRAVQAAIQAGDRAAVAELLEELHGHVQGLMTSPHGNYVLQTVITALPTAMSNFVVKELLGGGPQAARHRFGCRILCRLIEHSGASADLEQLLTEVLADVEELSRHAFAHIVVQSVLEQLPEHHRRIADALSVDALGNACHRYASHVMESVLAQCSEVERRELVRRLLGAGKDSVISLAQNQYGCFVLKALLQVPGGASEEIFKHLGQAAAYLEGTKYGQRLLQDLGFSTRVA